MKRIVFGALAALVLLALAAVLITWPRADFIPARSPKTDRNPRVSATSLCRVPVPWALT